MANIFQDITSDNDGDLLLDSAFGDLTITPSDEQHQIDIIEAFQGEWKEFPGVGVGIFGYLKSSGKEQELSRAVTVQLTADGFTVDNPKVEFDANGKALVYPNAYRNG